MGTVTLTPATKERLARLFAAWASAPKREPMRFEASGSGNWHYSGGYASTTIGPVGYWPHLNTLRIFSNTKPKAPEVAQYLAAVEAHWATLATPEAVAAAEAAHRQRQDQHRQAATERGQATIDEVEQLIWERVGETDDDREPIYAAARAVLRWAADQPHERLTEAARVAQEER